MTWLYEEPEEEEVVDAPVAASPNDGQLPDAGNDGPQPGACQYTSSFSFVPIAEANNVHANNQSPLTTKDDLCKAHGGRIAKPKRQRGSPSG
jgi:hypothetical protein